MLFVSKSYRRVRRLANDWQMYDRQATSRASCYLTRGSTIFEHSGQPSELMKQFQENGTARYSDFH